MKEATGELNMTVITVVAIAAVGAFFYAFVWPRIKTSINANAVCQNGPGTVVGTATDSDYVSCTAASGDTYTCTYKDGNANRTVTCKVK